MILTQQIISNKFNLPAPMVEKIDYGIRVRIDYDKQTVSDIIKASFGKALAPDYFESKIEAVIIDKEKRGVAIVKATEDGFYLDKFAVKKEYQSNGVGKNIWNELVQKFPQICWRAKLDNPINGWYQKKSDGFEQAGEWMVFWIGKKPDIERIAKMPKTLIPLQCSS